MDLWNFASAALERHEAEMIGLMRAYIVFGLLGFTGPVVSGEERIWREGAPEIQLVAPSISGPMENIVPDTLNGYFSSAFGWKVPTADRLRPSVINLVIGSAATSGILKELAATGLDLSTEELGEEGFRILSHVADGKRILIVTANTPLGLKHGCQELMYFRIRATSDRVSVDWPLDVRMKPQFPYRGVYMLPCWAAHDSVEHWKRVLKFHSELTLNRNWFWLGGFPLLPEYGGDYAGTDLADVDNVRNLVELCRAEGMKFYIGSGWFTWHHDQAAGGGRVQHATARFLPRGIIDRGVQYYLDMLKLLPGAEGIYLEPPGEGYEADEEIWRPRTEALHRMARTIWEERPEFEFAIAVGRFNSPDYRQALHQIDDRRLFWVWGWGDPIQDNALAEHPLVLRWHTTGWLAAEWSGSQDAPRADETSLTGFYTSWDPGQGFGNQWDGRRHGARNADKPLEFHPYSMPFFSNQYWFRERCWNVNMTREQFAQRLARRLFDADMPAEAIAYYLKLADFCPTPSTADEEAIDAISVFVESISDQGTPRNRDTAKRMKEALAGIRQIRAGAAGEP